MSESIQCKRLLLAQELGPKRCTRYVHCEEPGCERATQARKPYCSEHVFRMGYVAELAARIETRDSELDAAAKGERIPPRGSLARDVLRAVWAHGEPTAGFLFRAVGVPFEPLLVLLDEMVDLGVLTREDNSRNTRRFGLAPPHDLARSIHELLEGFAQ